MKSGAGTLRAPGALAVPGRFGMAGWGALGSSPQSDGSRGCAWGQGMLDYTPNRFSECKDLLFFHEA